MARDGRNIGREICEALGLARPDEIRRVVIDVQANGEIIVHTERYFSDKMLDVVRTLEGVKITTKEASGKCPDPSCNVPWHGHVEIP